MNDFFLPYNYKLKERARELRKNMTPAERKLWSEYLRRLTYKFMKQRPIDNFIVDFYCSQKRLVIEVDGDSHFQPEGIERDLTRTAILENYRLRLLRFSNDDVLRNFEGVCGAIGFELDSLDPA
nr:endonuclease domain-containing protein [Cyanobacterium aponinum]